MRVCYEVLISTSSSSTDITIPPVQCRFARTSVNSFRLTVSSNSAYEHIRALASLCKDMGLPPIKNQTNQYS